MTCIQGVIINSKDDLSCIVRQQVMYWPVWAGGGDKGYWRPV
jgi:hypothetical protein